MGSSCADTSRVTTHSPPAPGTSLGGRSYTAPDTLVEIHSSESGKVTQVFTAPCCHYVWLLLVDGSTGESGDCMAMVAVA